MLFWSAGNAKKMNSNQRKPKNNEAVTAPILKYCLLVWTARVEID